jgi:hypothetical protein
MPNWKPILLTAPNEFRPPEPPDCKSAAVKAETDAVRRFERTSATNSKAFYWQSPAGLITGFYDYANTWMFEDKTQNPPRAARVYALRGAVLFDALIASNDAKFAYWYLRPQVGFWNNAAVSCAQLSKLSIKSFDTLHRAMRDPRILIPHPS